MLEFVQPIFNSEKKSGPISIYGKFEYNCRIVRAYTMQHTNASNISISISSLIYIDLILYATYVQ